MNTIKFFVIFLWYYVSRSKAQEKTQQYVENELTTLLNMMNNEIWRKDICLQSVIFNGEPTTLKNTVQKFKKIKKYIEKKINNAEDQKVIEDAKRELYTHTLSSLLTISKLMYTALECLYSGLIVKFLVLYFHFIDLNYIHVLKPCVVKIMFNLLSFMEVHQNLRFTDHALLLSLMSINVLFYHDLNSTSDFDEKKVIARTVNMIERYRCKNCPGSDYYYANFDLNNSADAFKIILSELKIYSFDVDLKSFNAVENPTYDEEMYSPTCILLKGLSDFNLVFNNIRDIMVTGDDGTVRMSEVFERAINSYRIHDMFKYQMLLIGVIKDLFCMVFFELANEMRSSSDFNNALNAFEVFIHQIIPSNYPPYLYDPIKKIKQLVKTDLYNSKQSQTTQKRRFHILSPSRGGDYTHYDVQLSEETKQMLAESTVVVKESLPFDLKQVRISDFVNAVVKHKHFKSFRQVFQLFLSEPSALDKYRTYTDPSEILYTSGPTGCHEMPQLRKNLFLFRSLVVSVQHENLFVKPRLNGPDFATLSSMEHIKTNLAYVRERFNANAELMNIFAPITIHFKDAEYSNLESQLVKQYSLLTINLMENYEMDRCYDGPTFVYNLDMYRQILKDEKLYHDRYSAAFASKRVREPANFDRVYIGDAIRRNTMTFVAALDEDVDVDSYLAWVDAFVPNGYFYHYDGPFDSDSISWNGAGDRVDGVTRGVIEIDRLIEYETATVKRFVCSVLKKILYVAANVNELLSAGAESGAAVALSTIDADVEKFQTVLCPTARKTYTDRIIAESRRIFRSDRGSDPATVEKVVEAVAGHIALLHGSETADVHVGPLPDCSLDCIHYSVQTDVEYATEVLKFIKNNNLISENEFFRL